MTYNTISTKVSATASVKVVDMVMARPIANGYVVSARVHANNGTATVSEFMESKAAAEAVVEKLAACKGGKVTVKVKEKVENSYDDGRKYVNFYGKFSL